MLTNNFTLISKDHHRATRGRVILLFANACFAFLRLPETALVDGHCWGRPPYIRLIKIHPYNMLSSIYIEKHGVGKTHGQENATLMHE